MVIENVYLNNPNMDIRKIVNLSVLFVAGALIIACGSSSQKTSRFSNGIDSIKIEVSTKLSSNYVLLTKNAKMSTYSIQVVSEPLDSELASELRGETPSSTAEPEPTETAETE